MTEMIDRVAQALAHQLPGADLLSAPTIRMMARAAIEAMRTPTQAMRTAGAEAERPYGSIQAAYEAMIDEALK